MCLNTGVGVSYHRGGWGHSLSLKACVHVSVCMSLQVTDNPHVQGSFHQCEDAYRLVEVCLSLFNVARVVVEGETDLATGEGAEGGGRRAERKRGNPALKSLRNALWIGRHEVLRHGQETIEGLVLNLTDSLHRHHPSLRHQEVRVNQC